MTALQKVVVARMREKGYSVAEIAEATGLQYWMIREFLCSTPSLSWMVR